jgi:hypothetical protein
MMNVRLSKHAYSTNMGEKGCQQTYLKWLFKEAADMELVIGLKGRRRQMARHDDHTSHKAVRAQFFDKLQAIHSGHVMVCQNSNEISGMDAKLHQRLNAVGCGGYLEMIHFETHRQCLKEQGIIVHTQNLTVR